jgi:hypothetical protein
MNILKSIVTKTTLITSLMFSTVSQADVVTMIVEWSDGGKYFANGLLSFDPDILSDEGNIDFLTQGDFEIDFQVSVPSADWMGPSFTTEDFSDLILHGPTDFSDVSSTPLDFSPAAGNLIGTQIFTDPELSGEGGDFNIFSVESGFPSGIDPNRWRSDIVDNAANAELIFTVTRLENVEAVPIPAAAWLFGSALVGLGVLRKKK